MQESSTSITCLDFLRHGETQSGACLRGITDDALTELGWRQMFEQCQGKQWQALVSSPLRRCASFAAAWASEHGSSVVEDPAWMEINFGDWEGQTTEQICTRDPDALQKFYSDPISFTPPNAEPYPLFAARIHQAWDRLLSTYDGQTVLIVTHAGVIRALFSHLLNIPLKQSFQIEVPHACLTRFSCYADGGEKFVQLNFHTPV